MTCIVLKKDTIALNLQFQMNFREIKLSNNMEFSRGYRMLSLALDDDTDVDDSKTNNTGTIKHCASAFLSDNEFSSKLDFDDTLFYIIRNQFIRN